jgi:tRNA threonylcarbamoyl adenosine modification protein YeaZ
MKKNFLSIETSINRIFLVLHVDGKLSSLEKEASSSIEVMLNDLIKTIFRENNYNFSVLDFILISLGPGSYTGTRVGLAAAKAISLTLKKPLLGYSNFNSIYSQGIINNTVDKNEEVGVIIKANKYEFFFQNIKDNKSGDINIFNYEVLSKKNKLPKFLIGDTDLSCQINIYEKSLPKKEGILKVFNQENKNTKPFKHNLEPLYLRGHYAGNI